MGALECIAWLTVCDVDVPDFPLAQHLQLFAPVVIDYTDLEPFREIARSMLGGLVDDVRTLNDSGWTKATNVVRALGESTLEVSRLGGIMLAWSKKERTWAVGIACERKKRDQVAFLALWIAIARYKRTFLEMSQSRYPHLDLRKLVNADINTRRF